MRRRLASAEGEAQSEDDREARQIARDAARATMTSEAERIAPFGVIAAAASPARSMAMKSRGVAR